MRLPGTFGQRLALIAAGALGLRVLAAFLTNDRPVQGDAQVFDLVSRHVAAGEGFRQAFRDLPTAEHAPGWEIVLAGANLLGADSILSHRLLGALLGTGTVVLIGLLGRRVAGPAVGLTAATLAAGYPLLWGADVSLMSETLYGVLLVGALLAALDRRALALGLLLGLATLARGEALLLFGLLAVPALWGRRRALAVALAAFVVVLAPWTVRNLVTFERPVLISNNANGIFAGAYCRDVFYGDLIGSWRFQCYTGERPGEDESEFFARQREQGLDYLRSNPDRLPAVLVARLGRLLDVWDVGQSVFLNDAEGRSSKAARLGIYAWWPLALLAVAGGVLLLRRREDHALRVLLAPVATVVAVALVTYGSTRFRFAAEPSVVVLAATALVAAFRTLMTQFQVRTSRTPGTRVTARAHGQ